MGRRSLIQRRSNWLLTRSDNLALAAVAAPARAHPTPVVQPFKIRDINFSTRRPVVTIPRKVDDKIGRDFETQRIDTSATSNSVRELERPRPSDSQYKMQKPSREPSTILGKTRTNRCYQCHGCFGLIRRKFAMKQFCSISCVDAYKTNTERTIHRMKVWADFLGRKQGER